MQQRFGPVLIPTGGADAFPDPRTADRDGLLAIGGDLSVERLVVAYESGVFPWYGHDLPVLWWSPDPRAVIDVADLHVSRSLRRRLRQGGFELSWNRAFREVMCACGDERDTGSWIIPEMVAAYERLHRSGHAHSLEVWQDGQLAGGLYGVQRGGLFAAESKFHRRTDASKVALVAAVRSLFAHGVQLFDVQFLTAHLQSLGAREITREEYLRRLDRACDVSVDLTSLAPSRFV